MQEGYLFQAYRLLLTVSFIGERQKAKDERQKTP